MPWRRITTAIALLLLLLAAGIALANWWIVRSARGRIFHQVMDAPENEVGLVLGTSRATAGGFLNPFFTGRIETAARLLDAAKVRHLILSGDNHTRGYDEPADMRAALLEAGVTENALTVDDAGFRTLDSAVRAREVFGLSKITFITDDFHAARAVFLGRHAGLDAIAVCSRPVPMKWSRKTRLREVASRCKAWLDVYVLRTRPRFLGAPISLPVTTSQFKTTAERVAEFGEIVRSRLEPEFQRANVSYPPARIALVGLKEERALELYGAEAGGDLRFIRSYPILAASGVAGPKLREGDEQVPEGIYRVELLHPNSHYHLALRLNYPNDFDRAQAEREGRTEPGTDIMIHGGDRSRGCVAVGDEGAEDLFVVAVLAAAREIPIVLAPADLRRRAFPPPADAPPWTADLYRHIGAQLEGFPLP